MSTPHAITAFYDRIWNSGDHSAVAELLTERFTFRGSLGDESVGRDAFWQYVCRVRTAFADYHCEVLECVTKGDAAFARMRFRGQHVGPLLGYPPSGHVVTWAGAALFHLTDDGKIADVWVLGDLHGLHKTLEANTAG